MVNGKWPDMRSFAIYFFDLANSLPSDERELVGNDDCVVLWEDPDGVAEITGALAFDQGFELVVVACRAHVLHLDGFRVD